jgi:uncharacterized repeat protein (TIGR03803 family)
VLAAASPSCDGQDIVQARKPHANASIASGVPSINGHPASKHVTSRPDSTRSYSDTTVYAFGTTTYDGNNAYGQLIQASDGNLYGTTAEGGAHGYGTVFSISPTGTYKLLYSFTGTNDGAYPYASLVEGSDGYLYGSTTESSSASGGGTLFKMKPGSNSVTTVYEFPNGGAPYGGLVPDGEGNLYGTTFNDGEYGLGSIFVYNLTSGFEDLYDFSGPDGAGLEGSPLVAADGNLYGAARYGGEYSNGSSYGDGTVWEFNLSTHTLTDIAYLNGANFGSYSATGGLVQAANGNLYTTTNAGGQGCNAGCTSYYYNVGTVLQIVPSGASSTVTNIHSFNPFNGEGAVPYLGTLVTDASSNIYIAGYVAGANNGGAVMQVTTGGAVTTLYSFSGSEGYNPASQPTLAQSGNLYGLTRSGSTDGNGDIYEITPALTPVITLTPGSTATTVGTPNTLTWATTNAFSKTMQACFASSSDGTFTGTVAASGNTTVTPVAEGTVLYAVTCGGVETATASVTVTRSCAMAGICMTAASHNFVGVPENTAVKYGIQLANQTGAAFPFSLSMTGGSEFTEQTNCPASIPAGAKCEIVFTYTAPSDSEYDSAAFSIAANGATFSPSNSGTLTAHSVVSGSIVLNSNKHNFGAVTEGTSQQFGLNLTNSSTTPAPLTFTPAGDTADYVVSSNNCPATLQPTNQCEVVFTYTPSTKGSYTSYTYGISTGGSGVTVTPGSTLTLLGYGK